LRLNFICAWHSCVITITGCQPAIICMSQLSFDVCYSVNYITLQRLLDHIHRGFHYSSGC